MMGKKALVGVYLSLSLELTILVAQLCILTNADVAFYVLPALLEFASVDTFYLIILVKDNVIPPYLCLETYPSA